MVRGCRPDPLHSTCDFVRVRHVTALHRPNIAQKTVSSPPKLVVLRTAAVKLPVTNRIMQQVQAGLRPDASVLVITSAGATGASCSAVAMDLEYTHLLLEDGSKVVAPAWVALVDDECQLLLKTYIQPEAVNVKWSFGGVPYSLCATASNLVFVRQQLQQLLVNQILVGHGLSKDLAALGLQHPRSLQYDTISHPAFCNKAGNSRNLKWLAKQHLGLDIQSKPANPAKRADRGKRRQTAQHDPEEDAVAVMKLYQQVVLPSTYEGQVEAATKDLILSIQRRQQELAGLEESDS